MVYDNENRLKVYQDGSSVATYTYGGDGLKRLELVDGALTTLVWYGDGYLVEILLFRGKQTRRISLV